MGNLHNKFFFKLLWKLYHSTTYLKPLHHFFYVLCLTLQHADQHGLPALVEDVQTRPPVLRFCHRLPSDDVSTGAVEHHPATAPLDEHHRLRRHPKQTGELLLLTGLRVISAADHHRPHQRSGAVQLSAFRTLHLVFPLAPQREEGELGGGVDGSCGHVVLRQILQVFLPGASGHGAKLLRFLCSVLGVYHLRQEEVSEGRRARESGAPGEQGPK